MNSSDQAERAPDPKVPVATVLMVEDEEVLRVPVSKVLRKGGFVVIEAVDGPSAVDCFRAREAEISVVLLDMTLPSMSGPEVFEELLRIRPDVKVVLTSAYDEKTVMKAIGGNRSWAYIRKPYSPRELSKLLWRACLPGRSGPAGPLASGGFSGGQ